jgi:hypothetical protein
VSRLVVRLALVESLSVSPPAYSHLSSLNVFIVSYIMSSFKYAYQSISEVH